MSLRRRYPRAAPPSPPSPAAGGAAAIVVLAVGISAVLVGCAGDPAASTATTRSPTPPTSTAAAANPASPNPAARVATAVVGAAGTAIPNVLGPLVAPTFIDHDPTTDGSRSGFITAWTQESPITPVRTIADGDLVAVHSTTGVPASEARFDLFRISEGLVTEHWAASQQTAPPNPAGRTLFDGPTEIVDRDKTAANRAAVQRLMSEVFGTGAFALFPSFTRDGAYLQHNPALGDGVAAIQKLMTSLSPTGGPPFRYNTTHHVVADGNFVLAQSEGQIGTTVVAYYDLFRLEDGIIAEHWDIVAPVSPGSLNPNTVF